MGGHRFSQVLQVRINTALERAASSRPGYVRKNVHAPGAKRNALEHSKSSALMLAKRKTISWGDYQKQKIRCIEDYVKDKTQQSQSEFNLVFDALTK